MAFQGVPIAFLGIAILMKNPIYLKATVLTAFVIFAVTIAVFSLRPQFAGTRKGKPDENYVKSENCITCHSERHASWKATHHRRMTQDITPETVQGDFESGAVFEYLGVRTRAERRGREFFLHFTTADGKTDTVKVERTVGSRRMEQYLGRKNGQYSRLPVAYDLMQKRWMSLNGSFFYPDGENFNQHAAQWDVNCVFCHNVKAQPNFNFQTNLAKTEVAELGIACGACHGQGAEHIDAASSPLRRVLWSINDRAETHIVNPSEIDTDRSTMICGHCHGQRVPEPLTRIRDVMIADPFDAGEDLSQFYKPVDASTKLGETAFANRFWADGSPRLTAYEYQGMTGSACFTKGKPGNRINCLSCHAMHEGDVKGNITAEKRTNQACTQCHTELQAQPALSAHTKHAVDSKGSNCYSCHMPEVVYGVMSFHPTHRISVPEPALTATKQVPNACNQCHLDQSVNWAITQTKSLWPERFSETQTSSDEQFNVAEGTRGLFAGDALTRSMMADALARKTNSAMPLLVEAFTAENYPIVRYFAANGLARLRNDPAKPDYLADPATRSRQIGTWFDMVDAVEREKTKQLAAKLRAVRKDVDLEVGE